MSKFDKPTSELKTAEDRWRYFFKNAHDIREVDKSLLGDPILQKAFKVIERCRWSEGDLMLYEKLLKDERDAQAMLDAAYDEGLGKGLIESKNLKAKDE